MRIGCLYIPSFPAWTFEHAEGGDSRIAVVAAGKVIAAGKAARRHGVEEGITPERARTLCPDVRLRLRDAGMEAAAWEEVLERINGITPFIEDPGPPAVFFKPDDVQALRDLTGELSAQTGFAPARPTARLVALRAATGNVLAVSEKSVGRFLNRFGVGRLPEMGFEEETAELLGHFGYGSLGTVRDLSARHLKAQFGEDGERLFAMLHPGDEPPVSLYRGPRVIRVDHEFDDACREPRDLMPVLEHLVSRATQALRSEYCQRLRLAVCGYRSRARAFVCRILPEPVGSQSALMRAAARLLKGVLSASMEVETLTLELGALRHVRSVQVPLFRARPSVFTAVKAVHRRFPGAVCRAVVQPHVLFSEDEMRFDPFPETAPSVRGRRPG